jgi:hypothetical protein
VRSVEAKVHLPLPAPPIACPSTHTPTRFSTTTHTLRTTTHALRTTRDGGVRPAEAKVLLPPTHPPPTLPAHALLTTNLRPLSITTAYLPGTHPSTAHHTHQPAYQPYHPPQVRAWFLDLPFNSPIPPLYLPYTSPISPPYLHHISPISPLYLARCARGSSARPARYPPRRHAAPPPSVSCISNPNPNPNPTLTLTLTLALALTRSAARRPNGRRGGATHPPWL